eukprot:tig00021105_g18268.t1
MPGSFSHIRAAIERLEAREAEAAAAADAAAAATAKALAGGGIARSFGPRTGTGAEGITIDVHVPGGTASAPDEVRRPAGYLQSVG